MKQTILNFIILLLFFSWNTFAFGDYHSADTIPENLMVDGKGVFMGDSSYGRTIIEPGRIENISAAGNRTSFLGAYSNNSEVGRLELIHAPTSNYGVVLDVSSLTTAGSGWFRGPTSLNCAISHLTGYPDLGTVATYDQFNYKTDMSSFGGTGQFRTWGENGNLNAWCSDSYLGPNNGWFGIYDHNQTLVTSMYSNASGGSMFIADTFGQTRVFSSGSYGDNAGRVIVYGPNNSVNASFGVSSSDPSNGWLGIYDMNGNSQASLYIDGNGDGVVAADIKNFFMDDPEDPDREIWYASLEGPEAAAYDRGTATLKNGELFIPFNSHFESVVNPKTITVILTPHSIETYGLAVVEKASNGFRVKELRNGNGNFSFDWEVKGIRNGFENYEVYRAKKATNPKGAVSGSKASGQGRSEEDVPMPSSSTGVK